MATKKEFTPATPVPPMALLEIGGTCVVLPAEVATQVFTLLCHGEVVDYDWNTKSYKRSSPDSHRTPTLKTFSHVQYAQLALNDDPQ